MHLTDQSDGAAIAKALNYGRRIFQPQYWPHLRHVLAVRLGLKPPSTGAEARRRCAALGVDATAALAAIGFPPSALRSFAAENPERFAEAEARVAATGAAMGGAADLDLLYSLCLATGAARVLETGVAFGWSSLAILSALEKNGGGRLISVDMPYLAANADSLVGLAVPEDLRANWTLHRGADRARLPGAIAAIRPIDVAHYDSDKSQTGRRWAYPLIWEAIRPGGFLMSDDIEDNLAFLEFAEAIAIRPAIVRAPAGGKFSGILRKSG
jgi:predicted O-methyltransferase YrrM